MSPSTAKCPVQAQWAQAASHGGGRNNTNIHLLHIHNMPGAALSISEVFVDLILKTFSSSCTVIIPHYSQIKKPNLGGIFFFTKFLTTRNWLFQAVWLQGPYFFTKHSSCIVCEKGGSTCGKYPEDRFHGIYPLELRREG